MDEILLVPVTAQDENGSLLMLLHPENTRVVCQGLRREDLIGRRQGSYETIPKNREAHA